MSSDIHIEIKFSERLGAIVDNLGDALLAVARLVTWPPAEAGVQVDRPVETPAPELKVVPDPPAADQPNAAADEPSATEVFGNGAGEPTIPSPPVNVDLDSAGLPWDSRIHSEKKTTIKNGTWKVKRGTDKQLVADVLAELKAAAPAAPVTDTPEPPAPIIHCDENTSSKYDLAFATGVQATGLLSGRSH